MISPQQPRKHLRSMFHAELFHAELFARAYSGPIGVGCGVRIGDGCLSAREFVASPSLLMQLALEKAGSPVTRPCLELIPRAILWHPSCWHLHRCLDLLRVMLSLQRRQ